MRTIKFRRAHFNVRGEFICFTYWGKIDDLDRPSHGVFKSPSSIGGTRKTEDSQYLDLSDKNGKQVFQGDILQLYNDTFIIEIKYVGCRFQGNWVDESLAHLGAIVNQNWLQWEVIGNIYETPEKLTKI